MKKVILDTSFILDALRNKIDFLEEIKFLGLTPLIPKQVLDELKSIVKSKKKLRFKDEAKLALRLLKKSNIKNIDIKKSYVDEGIMDYAEKHKDVIIATMDYNLKKKIKNQKLVVRAGKKLEIV